VTLIFNLDLGSVRRFRGHLVERHSFTFIVGEVDTEPTLECTSHVLQHTIKGSTGGFHLGKTVQDFQFDLAIT